MFASVRSPRARRESELRSVANRGHDSL